MGREGEKNTSLHPSVNLTSVVQVGACRETHDVVITNSNTSNIEN